MIRMERKRVGYNSLSRNGSRSLDFNEIKRHQHHKNSHNVVRFVYIIQFQTPKTCCSKDTSMSFNLLYLEDLETNPGYDSMHDFETQQKSNAFGKHF